VKIAVSGKGGVGKTTIASSLAKFFNQRGLTVYAVDADADSSLGLALDIDEDELEKIKPIIEMRDRIGELSGDGALYMLNPAVDSIIREYSVDAGGIRFLRMGGIKKGGSACYCRENSFLKALINALIMDTEDIVILDMGAGIEHLTRGTAASVDLMLIVTEPGKSSVQTARVAEGLARELGIKEIKFIANKIRNEKEMEFIRSNFNQEELIGTLGFDEATAEKAMGLDAKPDELFTRELSDLLYKIAKYHGGTFYVNSGIGKEDN